MKTPPSGGQPEATRSAGGVSLVSFGIHKSKRNFQATAGPILKRKIARESGMVQPYANIVRLQLKALDGKQRETDCANTKSLF
jgi:hypothetical protein